MQQRKTLKYNSSKFIHRLSAFNKSNQFDHLKKDTGIKCILKSKYILFYYRYKKLEDEDISFIPGKLPDLIVHHKYAKAILSPLSETSSKIRIDFIDDSKICVVLAWVVFYPLALLFSSVLAFFALHQDISSVSAIFIFLFFVLLWTFITTTFTKNINDEKDDTIPLLENEIDNLLNNL